MVAMTSLGIPQRAAREQIASAIDVVIQVSRLSDGCRRVVSVQEVTGMEGDVVTMQEIFQFHRHGIDEEGKVIGHIAATGLRPSFAEKLELCGIELDGDLFRPQGVA
jgi:pilus assembly protein CpaF